MANNRTPSKGSLKSGARQPVQPLRHENIALDDLHFDPKNPRIPPSVNAADDAAVIDWMLTDATIIELMIAIGQQGYFPGEPLLVVPRNESGYTVIEGNRRLCALKLLATPSIATAKKLAVTAAAMEAEFHPDTIPSVVYAHREDILNYLGYRHITGVKPWDPLAKSKYLWQLSQGLLDLDPPARNRAIARTIGSRSDHVAKLLTAYALYEKIESEDFFKIKNLRDDPESIDFSFITTALSFSNLIEFIGLKDGEQVEIGSVNIAALEELTRWLFEKNSDGKTRLGDSRRLKDLNRIVKNEVALKAFRDHSSLSEALDLTGEPEEIYRAAIAEAQKRIATARNHVHKVKDVHQPDLDAVEEVMALCDIITTRLRKRLKEIATS